MGTRPQAMADDDGARCVGRVIGGLQQSSRSWPNPEALKVIRRNSLAAKPFGTVPVDRNGRHARGRQNVLEDIDVHQLARFRDRQRHPRIHARLLEPYAHETIRVGKRHRPQEDGVGKSRHGRRRRNPDRDAKSGRNCEGRRAEHATQQTEKHPESKGTSSASNTAPVNWLQEHALAHLRLKAHQLRPSVHERDVPTSEQYAARRT